MQYVHVTWLHDLPGEPVELYSELNGQREEVRKVEVYRDGTATFACLGDSSGDTRLGLEPLPGLAEIAEDPQFRPREISGEEFERHWRSARLLTRST